MEPLSGSTFREIIAGTGPSDAPAPEVTVRHVTTHSKRIHSDSAFFAIDGQNSDGHAFAADALANGAAVVVTRAGTASPELARSGQVVEVDDPLTALQRLAAWWRGQLAGQVVAVVGSNGKTITKDALAYLLGDTRKVYASPGSYNSKLGVPLAILGCPADSEVAIIELAVTAPGEMAVLEQIVRPDDVILTNVGARWRSQFDGDADQARELLTSAVNLEPDGWLLSTEQSDGAAQAAALSGPARKVLRGDVSQVPAFFEAQYVHDGFVVQTRFPDGGSDSVRVLSPSTEILDDVELAMGAAWLLGAGSSSILAGLDEYRPTSTRMEIWRAPTGVALIRDVATQDPIAVGSAVRSARRVAGDGRTVVVLAEDFDPVEPAIVDELAQIFAAEQVAAVYALDGELPTALSRAAADLERPVPVHLFPTREQLRASLLEQLGVGDVALVQAPRSAGIGDLSAELIESMAPTRLYLDASAIEENVSAFRRLVGPSVQILGVVKALAYGTGGVDVASCFEASGVDWLGVSTADEGVALRRSGIALPILVMLGMARDVEMMLRHRLTPVVYSEQMLQAVLAVSQRLDGVFPVHVEIDSGMHRVGFAPERAATVLAELAGSEHLRVAGIMTHYASADDPSQDAFTRRQTATYEEVLRVATGLGLTDVLRHAAATSATVRFPETHFDMVRIGLGLHGVHPSEATQAQPGLAIAFGLVSRIAQILELDGGEKIGYGSTYTVPPGGATVGVVPAGYNDGVAHALSNRGEVIVAGIRCPIRGKVSMDSMTIDLSDCPAAEVGSDVLILGRRGDWYVRPEQVAREIGSIPYEPMVRVGHRVQRVVTRH